MRNKLSDLNNHLFAQLERLGEEELSGEKMEMEINRSRAITSIASQIIANGTLVLKARVAMDDVLGGGKLPAMLEAGSDEK